MCPCNHCNAKLEFELANEGVVVPCPSCGVETKLFVPCTPAPPVRTPRVDTRAQYCPHCGTVARPKSITKGSLGLEIILWAFGILPCAIYSVYCATLVHSDALNGLIGLILLFFGFLPGVLYSLWRLFTRTKGCRACRQTGLIPRDSPRAKERLST